MTLSDLFKVLTPDTRVVVQLSIDHTQKCEVADFPDEHPKSWELLKDKEVYEVWYNNIYNAIWISMDTDFLYREV